MARRIHTLEGLRRRGVRTPDGCLEWPGYLVDGYGRTRHGENEEYVHRLAWSLARGPIPDGLCVCHHCDNRKCFEDACLFLGTRADNNEDRDRKGRSAKQAGESNPRAKITADQARRIRDDNRTLRTIAADFGLGTSQVHRIKTGQRWSEGK